MVLSPDERAALEAAWTDPRRRVGPLIVLRELGRGGMGQVLLAYDTRRDGLVALKTLLERATDSARARLEREARLLAELDHPGIARLHEAVFEGPGAPYLVMEFVRGRPLSELVDEDRPMAPREAALLVAAIARAVGAAHARGVVHRDLKPQNVMLREDGRPVVLDFGLARRESGQTVDLTRTGSVVGTLAYLAPEQIGDAKHADARADVYALGGILFTCLTGRVPFDGPAAVVLAHVRALPPPPPSEHVPDLDPALDALVLGCLAKVPAARPASAEEVARALDAWSSGAARASSRPVASRRASALAAGLITLGLVAAGTGLLLAVSTPSPGKAAPSLAGTPTTQATEPPASVPAPEEAATEPRPDEVDRLLLEAAAAQADAAAAEALCTRALALDPTRADGFAARGQFRYRQGHYKGAAEDYLEAARLEPDKVHHHVNAGVNLARAGERQAALPAYERALALEPDHPGARVGRADLLIDRGRFEEAIADLEAVLAQEPRNTDALAQLGFLHYKRQDHAAAAATYTRAIATSPRAAMLWVNRGHNLARVGRLDDALADLDEALRLEPGLAAAWKGRAYVRFQRGDLEGAQGDLVRCLELDPRHPAARERLAEVREQLARSARPRASSDEARSEARQLYRRAQALGPDRRQEADELFARALELAPDDAEIWAARGFQRYRRGAYRDAAADYAEAARLDPDEHMHHYNLGVNLVAAGDHAAGLRAHERALELSPDRPEAVASRAKALHHVGRGDEALASLEEVLARRPDDVDALDMVGYIRFARGEHEEAVVTFTRALELAPDRHLLRVSRASNLAMLRRFEEALRDCDRVLTAAPGHVPALLTRGSIRLDAGDAAGAVEDLTRAQALAPDDASVARKLAKARARLGDR